MIQRMYRIENFEPYHEGIIDVSLKVYMGFGMACIKHASIALHGIALPELSSTKTKDAEIEQMRTVSYINSWLISTLEGPNPLYFHLMDYDPGEMIAFGDIKHVDDAKIFIVDEESLRQNLVDRNMAVWKRSAKEFLLP